MEIFSIYIVRYHGKFFHLSTLLYLENNERNMPLQNEQFSVEIKGRLRQFYRILLSYGDFKQAKFTASYILEEKLHEMEDRRLLESLNCAMIIAYCRPFSGNDRGINPKIPDLPSSFLKNVPQDEIDIHKVVLEDRNTLLAHSDSFASQLQPEVWNLNGIRVLVPFQNDRRAPLTLTATKTFCSLVNRMFEKIVYEQKRLEPDVIKYFDEKQIDEIINK